MTFKYRQTVISWLLRTDSAVVASRSRKATIGDAHARWLAAMADCTQALGKGADVTMTWLVRHVRLIRLVSSTIPRDALIPHEEWNLRAKIF